MAPLDDDTHAMWSNARSTSEQSHTAPLHDEAGDSYADTNLRDIHRPAGSESGRSRSKHGPRVRSAQTRVTKATAFPDYDDE